MSRIDVIAALCLLLTSLDGVWAWHHEGHDLVATAAVTMLPEDVPEFVRTGGRAIAHASLDPDQWRHALTPQLTKAEAPNHYFHYEMFAGTPLPADRERYHELLAMKKLAPADAGLLPYAVVESTQALMMALAEHRRWPDNPLIRSKVLHYAGILAHYSGDLTQPLHCTVHWDGRANENHKSPRSGIHGLVDGLLVNFTVDDLELGDEHVAPIKGDLIAAISESMRRSNAEVDRVYKLETKLPKKKGDPLDPEVKRLALNSAASGARLTASLILSAWRNSAHVNLPVWLDREESDAR